MSDINHREQENRVACDHTFIFEKKNLETLSPSTFDALVETSADLVCECQEQRFKLQMKMAGL